MTRHKSLVTLPLPMPDETATTIKTIAESAGVSIATVSRVINRPELVAEHTRRRVTRVIQQHNFQISREAQGLRRGNRSLRTGRIGFLVPDFPHRSVESITEEMCRGAQRVISAHNLELVLHYYRFDADPLTSMPKFLRENSVDGILVRPPPSQATLMEFCRNRKAVVVGNTFADAELPCVISDDWAGMRMVLGYLHELGHRRIAFVSPSVSALIYLRRLQAYRMELEKRGIPCDRALEKTHDAVAIQAEETAILCRQYVAELRALPQPPTAIAAATDGFAAGLIAAAREAGWHVPQDVSITGFGDQYYAAFVDPPLTTVHIDHRGTGELAALQLLRMIEGGDQSVQTLVRPSFVERRSCASVKG